MEQKIKNFSFCRQVLLVYKVCLLGSKTTNQIVLMSMFVLEDLSIYVQFIGIEDIYAVLLLSSVNPGECFSGEELNNTTEYMDVNY